MSDLKSTLDRGLRGFAPSSDAFELTLRRVDRKRRNRRLSSAVLAIAIAAVGVGGLLQAFRAAEQPKPASQGITTSNVSSLSMVGHGSFGGVPRSVAVADGLVLVQAKGSNEVTAFPADCGIGGPSCNPVWVADTGGTPVVPEFATWASNGIVYVGADDLFAFSATCGTGGASCRPLWVGKVDGRANEPVVFGDGVFVTTDTGLVYRFPTSCASGNASCQPDWVSARQPASLFHIQVVGNAVVAQRFSSPPAYVAFPIRCSNGCRPEATWAAPRSASKTAVPTAGSGFIYMGTTGARSTLYAYPDLCVTSTSACAPSWSAQLPSEINAPPPLAANGRVFVGSTVGGFLKVFAAECGSPTCEPLWTAVVPNLDWTHPAVTDQLVFVGSRDGGVYAFPIQCSSLCKPVWNWGTGAPGTPIRFQSVTVASDRVYAISNSGDLYVFAPGTRTGAGGTGSRNGSAPLLYGGLAAVIAVVLLVRRRFGGRLGKG